MGMDYSTKGFKDTSTRNPSQLPDQQFYYIDISAIDNEKGAIKPITQILGKDAPSRLSESERKGRIYEAGMARKAKTCNPGGLKDAFQGRMILNFSQQAR